MTVIVEARQSHYLTRTVGSTSAQQKYRNFHILFCLANAGIMAHAGHGLVNRTCEWQSPNCLLGFTGSWETTGGGSSWPCTGKSWLSEAARQDLARHSQRKWRQAVCPALWMQKFWTHEQRNSLQTFDSSPEFRKLELDIFIVRDTRCHAILLPSAPFTEDSSKLLFPFGPFLLFVFFFKQDSFKRS